MDRDNSSVEDAIHDVDFGMYAISADERQLLASFLPIYTKNEAEFSSQFYNWLLQYDVAADFFKNEEIIERLQQMHCRYFRQLFSGTYDDAYIESRNVVGMVHFKISLGPDLYLAAFSFYLRTFAKFAEKYFNPEELSCFNSALTKIIFFDVRCSLDSYFNEQSKHQAWLNSVLENISESVVIIDPAEGKIEYCNRKFASLCHHEEISELESQPFNDYVYSETSLEQVYADLFDGKETEFRSEGIILRSNLSVRLVFNKMQHWLVIMIIDLSEEIEKQKSQQRRDVRFRNLQMQLSQHQSKFNSDKYNLEQVSQQICQSTLENINVSRLSLWLLSDDNQELSLQALYEKENGFNTKGMVLHAAQYPHYFKALRENRIIDAHCAQKDPRTFEFKEHYLIPLNIHSMLDVAIILDGKVCGVLCCEQTNKQRVWRQELISKAIMAADTYSLVLMADLRNKMHREIEFKATHDGLTGILNKHGFTEKLNNYLEHAKMGGAVAQIDVTRLRQVNLTMGYEAGDTLLRKIAKGLLKFFPESLGYRFARINSSHFLMMIPFSDTSMLEEHGQQLIDFFTQQSFNISSSHISVEVKIGIASCPEHAEDAEALLLASEIASTNSEVMNYSLYSMEIQQNLIRRNRLEQDLASAIENGEISLHYQVKCRSEKNYEAINVKGYPVCGAEALMRWNHPQLGFIPPDEFIDIAEESGLIHDLTYWALTEVSQLTWRLKDHNIALGRIAVNLSVVHLLSGGAADKHIISVLKRERISPEYIELEITESSVMSDPKLAIERVENLVNAGFTVAIDDYGTGYSSLAYLKQIPARYIKLDRAFVMDLPNDDNDVAIVKSTIVMSKALDKEMIAEGVETEQQIEFLCHHGCGILQGYYLSRPLPEQQFIELLS